MDHLWAPWRLAYVAAAKPPAPGDTCFLCQGLAETEDRKNLVVKRFPRCTVVLNRFPYNNGHLLIAPRAHKAKLEELDRDEILEIQDTLCLSVKLLGELMTPDGYNIGVNLGRSAGAGLPGHLHWHIVPRWDGDTSFISVLADTRVIAQSLDALYELLQPRFAEVT